MRNGWKNTFEDVIETGCLLILGGFTKADWRSRTRLLPPFSYPTARKLMRLAVSDRINDLRYRNKYPDSWMTLSTIDKLPGAAFAEGIRDGGVINRQCTCDDIKVLRLRFTHPRPHITKFTVELWPYDFDNPLKVEERQNAIDRLIRFNLAQRTIVKGVKTNQVRIVEEDLMDEDAESDGDDDSDGPLPIVESSVGE
jgi:hypothetical protein